MENQIVEEICENIVSKSNKAERYQEDFKGLSIEEKRKRLENDKMYHDLLLKDKKSVDYVLENRRYEKPGRPSKKISSLIDKYHMMDIRKEIKKAPLIRDWNDNKNINLNTKSIFSKKEESRYEVNLYKQELEIDVFHLRQSNYHNRKQSYVQAFFIQDLIIEQFGVPLSEKGNIYDGRNAEVKCILKKESWFGERPGNDLKRKPEIERIIKETGSFSFFLVFCESDRYMTLMEQNQKYDFGYIKNSKKKSREYPTRTKVGFILEIKFFSYDAYEFITSYDNYFHQGKQANGDKRDTKTMFHVGKIIEKLSFQIFEEIQKYENKNSSI